MSFAVKPPVGSIPAWAGETPASDHICGCIRVYPRVGGGNIAVGGVVAPYGGLSPRGRGKLVRRERVGR